MIAHNRPTRSRRGGVYLLVLGVSMVVVLIGVTAANLARIRESTRTLSEQSVKADLAARSAVEIVLKRLAADPGWRSSHTSGTWSSPAESIGDATFTYRLEDDDGLLADAPDDDADLTVRATVGRATRLLTVTLETPRADSMPNLLSNPGFESGTSDWNAALCLLSTETTDAYGGLQSMRISLRLTPTSGPYQTITSKVKAGRIYQTGLAIRILGPARSAQLEMRAYMASSTVRDITEWIPVPSNTWTEISSTLEAKWTEPPLQVHYLIYTNVGIDDILIDSVYLREVPAPRIVSGSWKRAVLP